jgi:uncharacterized integral membrane protein (TIGR00698 family)
MNAALLLPPFSLAILRRMAPGLALTLALTLAAFALAQTGSASRLGLTPLTVAIVLGMALGNLVYSPWQGRCGPGVDWVKQRLLRLGIILFGLRITFQDMAGVGWRGVLIAALMLCSTFLLSLLIGRRWLRLDQPTAILIGAGSAICGAAAVLATEPLAKGSADQAAVAVATVVVFGTLAMFGYPLLHPWLASLGASDMAFGIYIGSTVHEVAQVVVAGRAISDIAADQAVITKMIRVMMLAPFLLIVPALLRRRGASDEPAVAWHQRLTMPWFALGFVLMAGVHSLGWLPRPWLEPLLQLDNLLLAMAMGALGLTTHVSAIGRAGVRPLLLAALLLGWLVAGGALINGLVQGWLW